MFGFDYYYAHTLDLKTNRDVHNRGQLEDGIDYSSQVLTETTVTCLSYPPKARSLPSGEKDVVQMQSPVLNFLMVSQVLTETTVTWLSSPLKARSLPSGEKDVTPYS